MTGLVVIRCQGFRAIKETPKCNVGTPVSVGKDLFWNRISIAPAWIEVNIRISYILIEFERATPVEFLKILKVKREPTLYWSFARHDRAFHRNYRWHFRRRTALQERVDFLDGHLWRPTLHAQSHRKDALKRGLQCLGDQVVCRHGLLPIESRLLRRSSLGLVALHDIAIGGSFGDHRVASEQH